MINLGEILKEQRISQKEIALCCGVSQPTVSEWVSGKKTPSLENLAKLSKRLGVSMNYLTGIENTNQAPSVTEDDIKVALFGGSGEVTDEMWQEVKRFAEFVKQRKQNKT